MTGPGRPACEMRTAWATSSGMRSVRCAVTAHFVMGR